MSAAGGCQGAVGSSRVTGGISLPRPCLRVLPVDRAGSRRMLVYYRYISWFLTSLFYLVGPPDSGLIFKLGVILALLVAGRVAVQLYEYSRGSMVNVLALITAETLGIALLLIPTGGFDSPFIWYALNPIFVAAGLLPGLYCWAVLGTFLLAAPAGSAYFSGGIIQIPALWQEHSWLLLVLLLLTSAAQLFYHLINRLTRTCGELAAAHQRAERALAHTTALYQALEMFTSGEDPQHLAALLANYARKLTGFPAAVCCLTQMDDQRPVWGISDPEGLLETVRPALRADSCSESVESANGRLIRVAVRSHSRYFGYIGCLVPPGAQAGMEENQALDFLAGLGAIVLERCAADELSVRLRVAEEQNRIANEIHDGVSQHLFSIVFALHALSRKDAGLQEQEVQQQLSLVQKTANQAARELRASIYRISPRKRGEGVFVAGLASYLDGLGELNGIKVNLQAEGSEDALSPALRKAFYRIVREAAGNAVRHGKCGSLKVRLRMSPAGARLEVRDDGRGFSLKEAEQRENRGLGLANMRQLAASFHGELEIGSVPGRGTVVRCIVPRRNREEAVDGETGCD